jgi:hypothetical protein
MGRTVPSFRIVVASEKVEWKPFRNALHKKERNEFDEMWDISRLYVSACSNSVQLVPLQPIIISILFHHYKELKECISEVEQIDAAINYGKKMIELTEGDGKEKEADLSVLSPVARQLKLSDFSFQVGANRHTSSKQQ